MKNQTIAAFILCLVSLAAFSQTRVTFTENFNNTSLPVGWSTTAISGSQTWSFGIDGSSNDAGNNNLNGSNMAFFDDDGLGGGNLNNTASLTSPIFDNSQDSISIFEFTYNYRTFNSANDSFFVEVYDGLIWNTIFSKTNSDCGGYPTCSMPFPRALIDISAYKNTQCQLRFTYHDGNDWAYYVALDSILVYQRDSIDMAITQVNALSNDYCSNKLKLEVSLTNSGYATIHDFVLAHRVDSGTIYFDTISNQNFRNDTVNTFQINSPFAIRSSGNHNIESWVIKPGDISSSNDSISAIENLNKVEMYHASFVEDFDSIGPLFLTSTPSPQSNGWYEGNGSTGYILPRSIPNSTLKPIVLEMLSAPNDINPNIIYSPCISLKNTYQPTLSFLYRSNYSLANPIGPAYVEIFGGTQWTILDSIVGIQSTFPFSYKEIDLSPFKGQVVEIRFRQIPIGPSSSSGFEAVVIDDFSIIDKPNIDLELSTNSLDFCYYDTTANLSLSLKNTGANNVPANSVWLYHQGADNSIDSQLFNYPIIVPGNSINLPSKSINLKRSSSTIRAWLKHPIDTLTENDSVKFNQINNTIENFENISPNHTLRSNISQLLKTNNNSQNYWQVVNDSLINITSGPAFDHTKGAGSDGNYIVLNTTGTFNTNLVLDCINLGGTNAPSISFWYHKYGNQMGDLYIDAFDGSSWILGLDTIIGQTQTATNAAWKYRKVSLNDSRLKGNSVKLRFRAVGSGTDSKMAIDDISFNDIELQDLGLVEYVNPKPRQCFASTEPLIVTLRNDGFLPLDFTQDSVFITSTVIGPNFQTLLDTIFDNSLNGGNPLSSGDSITITIGQLNLQPLGRYLLSTNITMSSDDNNQNDFATEILDVLNPVGGTIELISHDTSINKVCVGDSIVLQSENSIGEIQWQEFIGGTWQDLVGETDTTISLIANKNSLFRVMTCSSSVSNVFDVNSILRQFDINILGDSLTIACGTAPSFAVYNFTNGIEKYNWYANTSAINPVYTGDTFKLKGTNVSATSAFFDTVYVEAEDAYIESKLGPQNPNLLGSFGYYARNYPTYFSFFNSNIINTIDVYPQNNGLLRIFIIDSLNTKVYFDSIYQITGGVKNTIFLGLFLSSGAYSISSSHSTMNGLLRNNSNSISNSFFNIDSSVVIYPQSNQNYYYYYNWDLGSECTSERFPVYLYADCLVGIEDENSLSAYSIFPNPSNSGIFNIEFSSNLEAELEVIDVTGKAVLQQNHKSGKRFQLDLTNQAKGVYMLQIKTKQGVRVEKLFRQ